MLIKRSGSIKVATTVEENKGYENSKKILNHLYELGIINEAKVTNKEIEIFVEILKNKFDLSLLEK